MSRIFRYGLPKDILSKGQKNNRVIGVIPTLSPAPPPPYASVYIYSKAYPLPVKGIAYSVRPDSERSNQDSQLSCGSRIRLTGSDLSEKTRSDP